MARLFAALAVFFFFLLLSTSHARSPTTSPGDGVIKQARKTKIFLPTKKPFESDSGSVVNIDVDGQKNPKESGEFSDELTEEVYKKIVNGEMPASGSYAGKDIDAGEKEKGLRLTWRPINRHFDRMWLIRRSFPVDCHHRGSRFEGRAQIRPGMLPFSEEEKDFVKGEHHHHRHGEISPAKWTTFHKVDAAVSFPDMDGEGMMFGEFKHPRFFLHRHGHHHDHHRHRRHHDEDEIEEHMERKGHSFWKKIRKFLTHL